jgi:hypothetical protein
VTEGGAYGLRLDVPQEARRLLGPAEPDWPRLELSSVVGETAPGPERVTEDRAELTLRTGGRVVVDRAAGRAEYTTPRPLGADELVHPYLAPAASIMAWWHGRAALHAGAFAVDGRAWAVVGEREAGKSSTLALLSRRGIEIVTDDLLVVDEGVVLPGPRAIDLREDASAELGGTEALGKAGARERWRLAVSPLVSRPALAGVVVLAWGDALEVAPLSAGERFAAIESQLAVRLPAREPESLLDLVALPAWRFSRSRGWDGVDGDVDRMLATVVG